MESLEAEIKERIEMIGRGKVPEGYKKTQVGIIPEEWEVQQIKDVSNINQSQLSEGTDKEYEFYYFDLSSVSEGCISTPKVKTKFKDSPSRARRIFIKNDILMSTVRPYLKGFGYVNFEKEDCVCSTGFAVITSNKKCDSLYIYHNIFTENINNQIKRLLVGSNYPAINKTDVERLKIPYSKNDSERKKIAQILSTWDEAIELKEKLLEEKKEQKKGLMQKLLTGEVRLPGFDGEWEEVRLGELGICIRGVSYKPDDLLEKEGEDSIVLLRANNIGDYQINHKELKYVKKSRVKEKQIIQNKDIVIAMSSGSLKSVGKIGFCSFSEVGMCVGAFCAIFRTKNSTIADYIKHFFETDLYVTQLISRLEGTNINNLKNSDIESLNILIPIEDTEMKKLGNILSTADKEIDLLEEELELLKLQKKGLMQLLLTGIIRVKC